MSVTTIIYDGPSEIDGKPIIALAQRNTRNPKTGDMMQTYILRSDIDPVTANRIGADVSICGACPLKGQTQDTGKGLARERACYVTIAQGPLMKYKALYRGKYDFCHDLVAFGRDQRIRIGTYGDGQAVPHHIWESLLEEADTWTGYTHQRNDHPDIYMTSVENLEQARAAWDRGERTFRVVSELSEITDQEVLCPASKEAGKRTTCARCQLCRGISSQAKSIAIPAHGSVVNTAKRVIRRLDLMTA